MGCDYILEMKLRDLKLLKVALILALAACGKTPLDDANTNKSPSTSLIEVPTNLHAEAISENTIQLSWTNPNISEDYWIRIEYKKTEETNFSGTNMNSGTSLYSLGNLQEGTSYDIRLQTIIGSGDKSKYTNNVSAITLKTVVVNPNAPLLVSPSGPAVITGELPVVWSYLASNGSNVKQFEVRFHLLNFQGQEINGGTFQMVPYPSADQSYETTRNLTGTGCGENDLAEEITFDVRATPIDQNINNNSAWVPARGWVTCSNIR